MPEANISCQDFVSLSREGDVIPVRYSLESDISPPAAYSIMRDFDSTGYTYMLESADSAEVGFSSDNLDDRARYSFVGFDPSAVVRTGNGEAVIEPLRTENPALSFDETVEDGQIKQAYDPLDTLRDVDPEPSLNRLPGNDGPFEGGLVGFHPYEMVGDVRPLDLETDEVPQSVFVLSDRYLAYDHENDELELVFTPVADSDPRQQYEEIEDDAEEILRHLESSESEIAESINILDRISGEKEVYEEGVEEVKEYVERGDIYQGVLSRNKDFVVEGDPLTVYEELREQNPSPYMYLLDFEDMGALGASPETLVRTKGDEVEIAPLAGTCPRGPSPLEDRLLGGDLLSDRKELAEHAMLLDLGRNDLKKICKPGTVEVVDFMDLVVYDNVQHIESIVRGQLEEGKDRFDAVRSRIPAGTLSGAPRKRAIEIIDELEDRPRNLYGGAVGYYSFTGDMDVAIPIRSMFFDTDEQGFDARVQAGAGVVHDSVPESEFDETEDKMSSIIGSIDAVNRGDQDEQEY